ncbi:hypothetical protein TNCV_3057471 [Trichonephila clavipes]|nr:hypothetical protein TNCV_3057471 [Trichonephila clavipes]
MVRGFFIKSFITTLGFLNNSSVNKQPLTIKFGEKSQNGRSGNTGETKRCTCVAADINHLPSPCSIERRSCSVFVEWAQNEIAVVPDFHKRILFSDEAHFWLNGYVNKQKCRIWSEANPQVYVETPLHREKLTVWCALRAGGILLQKR